MKLNNINIDRIYVGEVCIEEVYLGDQLIYSQTCTTPPSIIPSIIPSQYPAEASIIPSQYPAEPSVIPSQPQAEASIIPSQPLAQPSVIPSTVPPDTPEYYYWCIVPSVGGEGTIGNCFPDHQNSYCIYADSDTINSINNKCQISQHADFATCTDYCSFEEDPLPCPCPSPFPCQSPYSSQLVSSSPLPTESFISLSQPIQSNEPSTPIYLGGDVQNSENPAPMSYY